MPDRRHVERCRWWIVLALVMSLGACGGKGCSGCNDIVPVPVTPDALVQPRAISVRVTQQGFDVVADHIIGLMKLLFGASSSGAAIIDVAKLLPDAKLAISGGLGLFSGTASVRDLVLTLDLGSLDIVLVEGSSPARIRIAINKAALGVQKGVVAGVADLLIASPDAACQLQNGVAVGTPAARLATVSAIIDLVLDVDATGGLALKVEVKDPVLHDIGFVLKKDCSLKECSDAAFVGDPTPCSECSLVCDPSKLASDAIAGLSTFLQPVLGDLMELVANLLIDQILQAGINGKPLDIEVPLDLATLVGGAAPQLGALLGSSEPIRVRVRPSPQAFSVLDYALRTTLDGAVFAKARGCVVDPGADNTAAFNGLPQSPMPDLPPTMTVADGAGTAEKALQAGALIAPRIMEQALWSVLRSGLLCTSVDAHTAWQLTDGSLVLAAAALDLALPGLRQLVPPGAPLRITITPSAGLAELPRLTLGSDGKGGIRAKASLRGLGLQVEAASDDRWLTLLELKAAAVAVLQANIDAAGKLRVVIADVQVPEVDVTDSKLFAAADMATIAGPLTDLGLSLLLAEPMTFDLDLDALVGAALKLPIHTSVIGLQALGKAQDWLLVGIGLAAKGAAP